MKKIIALSVLMLLVMACSNNKAQEKELRDNIISFHEKVMADDEKAMVNKMKLDTVVLKAASLKADTLVPGKLKAQLVSADSQMMDWMMGFKPDHSGKTHDETMQYFKEQQTKVKTVDSLLTTAVAASSAYLSKVKK